MEPTDNKGKYKRPTFETTSKSDTQNQQPNNKESKSQDIRKSRREWTKLKNKDGFFIFLLGKFGSSKSTILGCMAKHIQDNYKIILKDTMRGKEGINYVGDLIETLGRKEFPGSTNPYTIISYDFTVYFPSAPDQESIDLTFIELSGEDIEGFGFNKDGIFLEEMQGFIEAKKEKIVFFVILPCGQSDSDFDSHYVRFLSRMKGNCHYMSIINSKWDMHAYSGSKRVLAPKDFTKQNFPSVSSWTKDMEDCQIFPFSVGEVAIVEGTPRITKLVLDHCYDITNWIFTIILIKEKYKKLFADRDSLKKQLIETENLIKSLKPGLNAKYNSENLRATLSDINSELARIEDSHVNLISLIESKK